MQIILLILILSSLSLKSQSLPGGGVDYFEEKTHSSTYYLSGEAKFGKMLGSFGLDAGIRGGIIFPNKLGGGFSFYYLLSNNNKLNLSGYKDSYIGLAYGGLDLTYHLNFSSDIQLEVHAVTGWSHVSYSAIDSLGFPGDLGGTWSAIMEPQAGIYIEVLKNIYIGSQIGYRLFFLGSSDFINLSDLNGIVGVLSIKAVAF